ncbi:N-acetylmuramic acid 6-phosphate etherase [Carnimonas bestiolae]|uniref:N-acetylmuramic acid 6-phosphate etherase n=1 Tax=Carnimonas bestiolae TaxID=3402172 RepID=UPI003EDC1475
MTSSSLPPTEQRHPLSARIDQLPTRDILALINDEDATVAAVVRSALPQMEQAVAAIAQRLADGGTLHYVGAGTSGRMAVLDAAEVPPTYGFPAQRIVAHLAGGIGAMQGAVEHAEDGAADGAAAVADVAANDVVMGVAASGTTPFVLGALHEAGQRGAFTIGLTSNPDAPLISEAALAIVVATGPEVITGSTRMKAASAQKMVLQAISTTVMIKLGRVRSNLMLGVQPTNHKLKQRAGRIVAELTQQPENIITALLEQHHYDVAAVLDALPVLTRDASAPSPAASDSIVLGIDIGGSGLRAVALNGADQRPLSAQEFRFDTEGSSFSLFPPEAAEALHDYVRQLADSGATVTLIGVGMAGAEYHPQRVSALQEGLQSVFPHARAIITSDSVASYVGAVGTGAGALLTVGTGSIAVASDGTQAWRRVDGLGFLAGDLGSGAWLGREAAWRAISGITQRAPHAEALESAFLAHFGSLDDYISRVHSADAPSALLASFARKVTELAASGDQSAIALCNAAVDHLFETARQAADGLSPSVTLSGGLLSEGSWLRARLISRLQQAGLEVQAPLHSASQGAAILAQRYVEGGLPEAFSQQVLGQA